MNISLVKLPHIENFYFGSKFGNFGKSLFSCFFLLQFFQLFLFVAFETQNLAL